MEPIKQIMQELLRRSGQHQEKEDDGKMTKVNNQFNPNIVRALMALRGESQEDLANAIGCGRSLLSKVLTKKANFSASLEKRLADHYKVDSSIFFLLRVFKKWNREKLKNRNKYVC